MPFSGGTYTKARDFTTDAANNVNPTAANFDEVIDDIQTALSSTFLRDGSVAMTGGLDLGSHALSGATTISASSSAAITGDLAINTNKFTVNAASGNVVAAGTLKVTGDFAVNTNKFTVNAASGNVVAAGTLGVTGDFAVNTSKFTVNAASGNVVAAGTIKSANPYASYAVTGGVAINAASKTTGNVYVVCDEANNPVYSLSSGITVTSTTSEASFTVVTAGVYRISASVAMAVSTGFNTNASVSITKNGTLSSKILTGHTTLTSKSYSCVANGAFVSVDASIIVSLAANDVIRACYSVPAAANVTVFLTNIDMVLVNPA